MQIPRNDIRFERIPQRLDEMLRALGPRGQRNIPHLHPVVPVPEINPRVVHQKPPLLFHIVKLRDQLLEIRHVVEAVPEHVRARVEHPVRMVEPAALQTQHVMRVHPDQVEEHEAGGGVVRAVHEFRVRHFLVALDQPLEADLVQGPDGLREVPVHFRVVQVEGLAGVVRYDPGEDRVLRQIVPCSIA